MTITLNVLIALTGGEKMFSVCSEPIPAITGLDLAVGAGFSITDDGDSAGGTFRCNTFTLLIVSVLAS